MRSPSLLRRVCTAWACVQPPGGSAPFLPVEVQALCAGSGKCVIGAHDDARFPGPSDFFFRWRCRGSHHRGFLHRGHTSGLCGLRGVHVC